MKIPRIYSYIFTDDDGKKTASLTVMSRLLRLKETVDQPSLANLFNQKAINLCRAIDAEINPKKYEEKPIQLLANTVGASKNVSKGDRVISALKLVGKGFKFLKARFVRPYHVIDDIDKDPDPMSIEDAWDDLVVAALWSDVDKVILPISEWSEAGIALKQRTLDVYAGKVDILLETGEQVPLEEPEHPRPISYRPSKTALDFKFV